MFFFNDTATAEIYTLSLHDALPIYHTSALWACDFLPVTDVCFRPLYAFFVVALGSRRVAHVGVTRHPSDAWVAQQLRERSEEHTSELQSRQYLVCRLLLEKNRNALH